MSNLCTCVECMPDSQEPEMSNKDKMKMAFANSYWQPVRYSEAFEASRRDFEKGWQDCAAIKDAEIAAMKQNWQELRNVLKQTQKSLVAAEKEIAACDLMIKELRKALDDITDAYDNYECYVCARKALAKSEHHNSRALEKMLLEAEIKGLRNQQPVSNNRRLCECGIKLAELNKE